MLWETVALDAERAELRHLVVDLLEARDAALFEHDEELGQHLRDRDRIVGRAVVVELRELQVVGHDVELVLAELGQEILRENQRVEIRRLERDAALFAACADEADIKLRIVRSERAAARKGQKRVQRVLQLRRAAQHVVCDAGQADDLRRKPTLGVDKGLERVDDLAVFQNDRTDLGDGIVRDLQTLSLIHIFHTFLAKMDKSLLEAANDLGATPVQAFLRVTLPLSLPGVISGITLVFLPAVSSFFIPKLLGGGQYVLVGNIIETQFLTTGDWNFGSAISLIMAVIIMISMWLTRKADVQVASQGKE